MDRTQPGQSATAPQSVTVCHGAAVTGSATVSRRVTGPGIELGGEVGGGGGVRGGDATPRATVRAALAPWLAGALVVGPLQPLYRGPSPAVHWS